MTPSELQVELDEISRAMTAAREKNLELEETGIVDKAAYDKTALVSKSGYDYVDRYGDFDDVIKSIEGIKAESLEREKTYIDYRSYGIEAIEEVITHSYEYYEVISEDNATKKITVKQRDRVADLVFEMAKTLRNPPRYRSTPDCKMVKLFMNGAIDFQTLATLTYSGCEV